MDPAAGEMAVSDFTQKDYQTLCGMIAKGVTSLKLGNGEEVSFRSLDEMLRTKALMERSLGMRSGSGQHYPSYRKG